MSGDDRDVQARWVELRSDIDERYRAAKDSPGAVPALFRAYEGLTPEARIAVDALLVEWIGSPNEAIRFEALALVREFTIVAAIPALRQLALDLENQTGPSAPYDWAKVNRILGQLTADAP